MIVVFFIAIGSRFAEGALVGVTRSSSGSLTNGLVGHWTFDGKDIVNGVMQDKSGSGNNGNFLGIATSTFYAQGKMGQAGKFSGAQKVDVSSVKNSIGTGNVSISLFMKPTNSSTFHSNTPYLFSLADAPSTNDFKIGIAVDKSLVMTCDGGGHWLNSSVLSWSNSWYHIVATCSSTEGLKIYRNNSIVAQGAYYARGGTLATTAYLGSQASSYYFNGLLDDVRIYNRAISTSTVQQLYSMGGNKVSASLSSTGSGQSLAGISSGLVGHWTFDGKDMANGVAQDKSGNGNNGNVINIATSTFYAQGKIGQAGKFDGVDDYVEVADASELNPANVTLSAWVKTTTSGGYIIAKDPPITEVSEVVDVKVPNKNPPSLFAIEKDILILSIILIFSFIGLGFYKSRQKEISANIIIIVTALSGCSALIYEVASTQALTYFFNSSSYSVATAIISFLFGLALGSFIISKYLSSIKSPLRLLVIMQILAGIYALIVLTQYQHILYAMPVVYDLAFNSPTLILILKFLVGISFLIFPTVMLGASFPLASSLIIKDVQTAGSVVGKLYSWDLVGAVLGALLSGFILLPIFGLSIAFVFGATINIIAGLLIYKIETKRIWFVLLTTIVLIFLIGSLVKDKNFTVSSSGTISSVENTLFKKESAFGAIAVTNKNNNTSLSISKIIQCDSNYPLLETNLDSILGKLPGKSTALDVGLGCGYSAQMIASSSKIDTVEVVDINPVLQQTLKYFGNDNLLKDKKVVLRTDDILHFLARTQSKYDFVNVELNMPSLSQVSPFYSVEYFQLLKKKVNSEGTIRLWVCCGNYEFVKAVYKTLDQVYGDITIKTDMDVREGKDYYWNTEFIISKQKVLQNTNEKNLQERIKKDQVFKISTLDNQSIGQIWYDWSQKDFKDYFVHLAKPISDNNSIKSSHIFPLDVKPGDNMNISSRIVDKNGIQSVIASFPHEKGTDWVDLKLVKGTIYDGLWKRDWFVHDTIDKEYKTVLTAKNKIGTLTKKEMSWTDFSSPCTDIYFTDHPYTANVGSTVSVNVFSIGTCGTKYIQTDVTGSYVTIPSGTPTPDPYLDCNGDTCSSSLSSFTKSLKCESAGVYNIKATNSVTSESPPTTVTCGAEQKTNVPYALSMVNGGQFMMKNGANTYTADSVINIADGKWHHLVGRYDGVDMRVYVDGVQKGASESSPGTIPVQAGSVRVGADYQATPANFFNGSLDDVRIYNRALSVTEIQQLYSMGGNKVSVPPKVSGGLASGLMGYWTFDGKDMANGVAQDKSGNGNNGNLINIATSTFYAQGKMGQGLKFDGVDDRVKIVGSMTSTSLTNLSQKSVFMWIKILNPSKINISSYDGGYWTAPCGDLFIKQSIGYSIDIFVRNSDCTTVNQSGNVIGSSWAYVGYTYDGSKVRYYVNGALTGTPDNLTGTIAGTGEITTIGARSTGTYSWDSLVDDVRIYNRALSASEVKQLYNMGR